MMASGFEKRTVPTREEWNALMAGCREVDLQQTWEYGSAVQACIDWEPIRETVILDGRPVAMVQALTKEVPFLGPVVRMQHGPMFLDKEIPFSVETALGVIDFLRRHWVEEKGFVLNMSPCLRTGELPREWAGGIRLQQGNEVVWQSIRIDLGLDPDQLRANLNSHWRRRLKQAEKSGMSLERLEPDQDLDGFLDRYHQFALDKGFTWPSPPPGPGALHQMGRPHLSPSGPARGKGACRDRDPLQWKDKLRAGSLGRTRGPAKSRQ